MWVKIKAEIGRPLYIAICYFPPSTSHYATLKGQCPFVNLDEDIWDFSRNGEVILVGDFNARTGYFQTVFYDTSEEMLREMDANDLSLARHSQDKECTSYGRSLIDMGTTHGLAILNGLQIFPASNGFTCFPHRHGASTVDYVLAQSNLIPLIKDFNIGPRPIGIAVDHAILSFTILFQFNATRMNQLPGHTRYIFTSESDSIYMDGIYKRLANKDPKSPLKELTEI